VYCPTLHSVTALHTRSEVKALLGDTASYWLLEQEVRVAQARSLVPVATVLSHWLRLQTV